MKVLVIGAGNMGLTYAEGMSKSKLLNKNKIMILDKSAEKIEELNQVSYFDAYSELEHCVPKADVIFIAVKPYHAVDVFKNIKSLVKTEQIIVSIMAGVTIGKIKELTGLEKVVRAMPNLPAQIGKGLTSYVTSKEVSRIEILTIASLLNATGKSIHVSNEKLIDASTGISGSGPSLCILFYAKYDGSCLTNGILKKRLHCFSEPNIYRGYRTFQSI